MRIATCALVAACALPAAGSPLCAQSAERVEARVGERRAQLRLSSHRGYPVVNGAELASAVFPGATFAGPFMRAALRGRELFLEAGSPFFSYGDATGQLANAPYEWGGAFWVPAELVTRWLPSVQGGSVVAAGDPERPRRLDPTVPWHVVIDPGHGGRDPGTLGRRSREKDVVLAIGRMVREELRGDPVIVPLMTRDTDVYVPHDDRSAYAVREEGDLFVSIHANAASARSARGFETIFLGVARSEEARQVALRENRTPDLERDGPGAPDELTFILTGLDRTENLAESRRFAGFIQNALRRARGGRVPDRGVKQGPWWVLLGALAKMPSVIVEVGFLSNADEERYLMGEAGQRAIARAIADAVADYRRDVLERFSAVESGEGN